MLANEDFVISGLLKKGIVFLILVEERRLDTGNQVKAKSGFFIRWSDMIVVEDKSGIQKVQARIDPERNTEIYASGKVIIIPNGYPHSITTTHLLENLEAGKVLDLSGK